MGLRAALFSGWTCLACAFGAWAQAPRPVDGALRASYEVLRLPGDERMGLVGLTRTLAHPGGAYVGLGVYGAVTGRRGGFFTGGFELGWDRRFARLAWSTGLFVGGGGGGAAPQGGGLMLRPYLGMGLPLRAWTVSLEGSAVRFPNGAIESRQWALSASRPWALWVAPGWATRFEPWPARRRPQWFGVQSSHYFPVSGTLGRHGRPLDSRIDLIGVRWRPRLAGPWHLELETAGAWGGGVDGYAQVLAGPSYWRRAARSLRLGGGAMLGAAGGGAVDTGGGIVARLWSGLMWSLPQGWGVNVEGGVTAAREGGFTAPTLTLALMRPLDGARPLAAGERSEGGGLVRWRHWRVRPAWQRYVAMGAGDRKTDRLRGVPVDLVGLKLDAAWRRGLYLTGQAWGAYDGGAGGYAVGLVGLGWSAQGRWRPWVEVDLGAAGGGGVAVGSGILAQPMLGLARAWGRDGSLSLGLGHVTALTGALRSPVLELALAYRFSTPSIP